MITADEAREAVRPSLCHLIEHHVEQGSPRMHAYSRVAAIIGRSAAWVQRIVGRDTDATVGLHDALNIRAAYDRLCARVEADNDRLDRELRQIREDHHAPADTAARQPGAPRSQRRRPDIQFRRVARPAALMAA